MSVLKGLKRQERVAREAHRRENRQGFFIALVYFLFVLAAAAGVWWVQVKP